MVEKFGNSRLARGQTTTSSQARPEDGRTKEVLSLEDMWMKPVDKGSKRRRT